MVAPWIVCSATGRPRLSRRGTDARVVTSVPNAPPTTESDPHAPVTLPAIERPSVNCQPVIGVHAGWLAASMSGSMGWPALYGVSTPRSRRLSWMLLRARFAVMSVYVGHCRAAIVTKKSVPCPSGPGGCWALAGAAAKSSANSVTMETLRPTMASNPTAG